MADRPVSSGSTLTHVTEKTEVTGSHASSGRAGMVTPGHKSWTAFQGPVLFTGPSGLRDQRVNTNTDFLSTGENLNSSEITSQMGYLNRPPPGSSFPVAKNGRAGEIGWIYDKFNVVNGI